jgi:hypothetical protein
MEEQSQSGSPGEEVRCAECQTVLGEGQDRVTTEDGAFCRSCFRNLTAQLQQALAAQETDINYGGALAGGLAGAAAGVLAWWGFTVVTGIAFGLVAVVIGVAVGKGVVMLSGNKRHASLQALSVVISVIAFFYASYLVNRSLLLRAIAEEGQTGTLPLVPNPALLFEVVKITFGIMDLVFLAIVVYEAWKIPAPIRLAAAPDA